MQAAGLACALGVPGWRLVTLDRNTDEGRAERLLILAVTQAAHDAQSRLNAEMWFGRGDPS